jgi:hypothetical protein
MLPLFALPLGAWAIQKGWIVFGTCGLKMLVGVPCLTCGATRATIHLLHGNLGAALAMQPLVIVAYIGLSFWGIVSLGSFLAAKQVRVKLTSRQNTAVKAALLVLPFANWVYLIGVGV